MRRARTTSFFIPEKSIKQAALTLLSKEIYRIEEVEVEVEDDTEEKTQTHTVSTDSSASGLTDVEDIEDTDLIDLINLSQDGNLPPILLPIDGEEEDKEIDFEEFDFPAQNVTIDALPSIGHIPSSTSLIGASMHIFSS